MAAKCMHVIETGDWGAYTARVGDLDGDGLPELLVAQSWRPTREISCLTAVGLDGRILWRWGEPDARNWDVFSDLPVQVCDWDGDGRLEVLWVEQAVYVDPLVWDYALGTHVKAAGKTREEIRSDLNWAIEQAASYEGDSVLHVLDGATGIEKRKIALPAGADDCLAFANLTGDPEGPDLVVKDRYWKMWGVSHRGQVLWKWKGDTGHFPGIGDADGDGWDEVFTGGALLRRDGTVVWKDPSFTTHQDSCSIVETQDGPRLASMDASARLLSPDGTVLWSHPFHHGQHMVPGRFAGGDGRTGFAVADRWHEEGPERICMFDFDGRLLWERPMHDEARTLHIRRVRWEAAGDCVAAWFETPGEAVRVFDGAGNEVATIPGETMPYLVAADVLGDSREEILAVRPRKIEVWTNAAPFVERKLANATYYPGD
jgi:hypothetical protein